MLAKLALRSPFGREVGRRHGQYLKDLNRRFNSGDFAEALRRAVPLGKEGGSGGGRQTLRVPGRRDSLALSNGWGSASSVGYGPAVFTELKALYRQAATTLEGEGRIDEAAFVLAELLNDVEECIALLLSLIHI